MASAVGREVGGYTNEVGNIVGSSLGELVLDLRCDTKMIEVVLLSMVAVPGSKGTLALIVGGGNFVAFDA